MSPALTACLQQGVLSDGGISSWPGGYCTALCGYDNVGTFCGGNGVCVTFGTPPNSNQLCMQKCSAPGTRSTCRPGYTCRNLSGSSDNICYPDCTNTGCTAGACNTTTGACQ